VYLEKYAPTVSSPDALKVINSSTIQSVLPSPSFTYRALGRFASMPFLPSTDALTLSSMLAARRKVVKGAT
jgi:hypothetical protein